MNIPFPFAFAHCFWTYLKFTSHLNFVVIRVPPAVTTSPEFSFCWNWLLTCWTQLPPPPALGVYWAFSTPSVFDSKRFRLQAFPTPSVFSWALMNGILTSKVEHGNRRSLSSVEWKALHLHGRSQTCRFFCWQSTRSSKCFIFRSFRECALTSQRRKTCILTRKTPPVLIFVKIILIKIVFLELITTKMQVSLESVQWPFHPFGLGSIHVMSQLPQHPNQPFMQQTHHKMLWIQNSTSAVLELSGRCVLNTWLFMMRPRVTRRPWHLPTAEALSRRAEFHSEENKQMESITLEASYSSVEIQLLNRAATSGSNKLYKHELT